MIFAWNRYVTKKRCTTFLSSVTNANRSCTVRLTKVMEHESQDGKITRELRIVTLRAVAKKINEF